MISPTATQELLVQGAVGPRKPALRLPKPEDPVPEFPLLDQSVVAAALSAGVDKKALGE